MGDFHCPIGAVGYDGMGCIKCGMCVATSKSDIISATNAIRNYLKSTAAFNPKKQIHKIAVCGKGGAGKSTITAMLAFSLEKLGYSPLVIDTDDSNAGLHRKLGISDLPLPLLACLNRFSLDYDPQPLDWLQKDPLRVEDMPTQFITRSSGIAFMMSGKIENPLQGCSCEMSEITKQIVSNLSPSEKDIVLVDYDAGIESFGRGAEQQADMVIIIVEPSYESIALAETIQYMAQGLGIRRIRAIINKVQDEEQEETIQDLLSEKDIRFLGTLYTDKMLSRNNLLGVPVSGTEMQNGMDKIAALMLDEAEMKYPI